MIEWGRIAATLSDPFCCWLVLLSALAKISADWHKRCNLLPPTTLEPWYFTNMFCNQSAVSCQIPLFKFVTCAHLSSCWTFQQSCTGYLGSLDAYLPAHKPLNAAESWPLWPGVIVPYCFILLLITAPRLKLLVQLVREYYAMAQHISGNVPANVYRNYINTSLSSCCLELVGRCCCSWAHWASNSGWGQLLYWKLGGKQIN